MNYGPLLFLAAFFGLATSWFGFVLLPQVQIGQLQQTNTVGTSVTYPLARPGLAREGLGVYRANGCAYCHSQQVRQSGTVCEVMLTERGTNEPALLAAVRQVKPGLSEADARRLVTELPTAVLQGIDKTEADRAMKILNVGGAKASLWIVPVGPDIARGWGKRRTVAEDFLFDYPVMAGSQRIGPDLANLGVRQPDVNWHLRHLYWPRLEVKGSAMPAYGFLFERRKVERARSPDALALPPELAPPPGWEIVPTPQAKALAAYLVSLRAEAPLFAAPMTVASSLAATDTNSPSPAELGSTNSATTNAPSK